MFVNTLKKAKNLKIGIFEETELLPVSNSVKRAMKLAISSLEAKGYKTVKFPISSDMFDFARDYFFAVTL